VRSLLKLNPEEVIKKAGDRLIVCEDLEELHLKFAEDIFNKIHKNNENNKPTNLILPIGPIGQYPFLVDMVKKNNLSLSNCRFFFMDEYCDESGFALKINHPLSFKRIAKATLLLPLKEYGIEDSHIIFPNEENINNIRNKIVEIGGIDSCYGGIGVHGHIAFNEPNINIATSNPRKVNLNKYTITINSIRANVGGNLENFPKEAYTIGMKQILEAGRIRLYCRNGSPYDWANTILRISLFGEPGDDYPVTHIRNHPDYKIITDRDTLATPKYII